MSKKNSLNQVEMLSTVSEISDLLVRLILKRYSIKEEISRLIYDQTKKIIKADGMVVALCDKTNDVLYFPLAFNDGNEITISPRPRKPGEGLTEYIIEQGKPLILVASGYKTSLSDIISQPWIGTPIRRGEEVIGVISFQRDQKDGDFNEVDSEIIQVLAKLVSSTIGYSIAFENGDRADNKTTVQRNSKERPLIIDRDVFDNHRVLRQGNTIFISYASEDLTNAKRLCQELREAGFDPWIDKERLIPGQKWKDKIIEAIQNSRFFVALLSENSISKTGFVQKELKEGLEVLELHPESETYLIPVRLDNCQISHRTLNDLQWVEMFPNWDEGFMKIKAALNIINST